MPIRINLLAEEQAAEEMRRRDPIKRTIFVGIALVVLMVAWIAVTQMNVRAARQELAGQDARLRQLDDASKQVRANQLETGQIDGQIGALEKYSTNRFFVATLLDAIQQISVDNLRLVDIRSEQKYAAGDANKFFTTNVTVKYTPPAPWWKFWAGPVQSTPVLTLISNSFASFTNKPPFTTNVVEYAVKITPTSTNTSAKQITAKVEFSNVPWAMEAVVIEIRGRDYGTPPGPGIDEYARRLGSLPFFKELLDPTEGLRMERPPQPQPDPQDPVNPNIMFVPFMIELRFKERVFTNE